jgi:protein-tyrosine phosphatase
MTEQNDGPKPFPNSYLVPGALLFAGEYPGARQAELAERKLAGLLDAGVSHCIDLTEEGELYPYYERLTELAGARGVQVVHERLSIPDMDVPYPMRMMEILDAIDASLAAGRVTYVHCWGGIGRTGTVIGCHLVRRGRSGEDALAEVQRLYEMMTDEKRAFQPESPQTEEQKEFVRAWREKKTR